MDNLVYTHATGNQLSKVEDRSSNTAGFNNGKNITTEYTYNTSGSQTKDENKGVSSVTYNMLGKVQIVNFTSGKKIEYIYDAAGTKHTVKVWQGTTLEKTTDYAGGFVYEGGVLSFFSSPEGRVVKNGSNFEYQYAIADHQGNTRVLFTSATPAPYDITATFEGDSGDNANQFSNVDASKVVSFTAANHTTDGSMVVRMNQAYTVGPSKSLKVYPGDKVDMEVWAYHENASGFGTTTPAAMIAAVAAAFGGVSGGGGESGSIFDGVNNAVAGGFAFGGNAGDEAPAAYLNYIQFDQQYKPIDAGWERVSATTFTKAQVSIPQLSIKEPGYVFVYLSYEDESNNYVYFDDFKVTHTKSNIIQASEYYPFGMQTASSWTRENATANNFLANGGTELNTTSQLYDLEFRNYDPALGRMNQVDPMAAKYATVSPYNYSFNNPVSLNDPSGADPYNHSPGTYFYGTYYTYDDFVPNKGGEYFNGMAWRDKDASNFWAAGSGYGSAMGGMDAGWSPGQGGIADQIGGWNPNFAGPNWVNYGTNENPDMQLRFASQVEWDNHRASMQPSSSFSIDISQLASESSLTLYFTRGVLSAFVYAHSRPKVSLLASLNGPRGLDNQGGGLVDFLKANFGTDYEGNLDKIDWILDTEEKETKYNEKEGICTCGRTKGYYDPKAGTKVQVYINPFALTQAHSFGYLTIGHEFVHAKHRSDGTRLRWNADYGGVMGHNLSEYYAYEWQILTAQSLGYPLYGAIEGFNKYKELVKDILGK